jgi:hypothetical protein
MYKAKINLDAIKLLRSIAEGQRTVRDELGHPYPSLGILTDHGFVHDVSGEPNATAKLTLKGLRYLAFLLPQCYAASYISELSFRRRCRRTGSPKVLSKGILTHVYNAHSV